MSETECPSAASCGSSCGSAGGSTGACSACAARRGGGHSPASPFQKSIAHTLFIMSGKGGVGKSAVTVNLALALADRGYRVGILDVDMHGPSVPGLLGLKTRLTARDEKILNPVFYNNSIAVVSIDFFLENRDMAIIWRGPKKTAAISQFLASVNWGKLDYLLIDSPPGTGDEHLAVLKAVPDAKCVMVTTSQEISLADVRKALSFLERVNASLFGLIENMSGFACPHCGGAIDIFSAGKGELLARDRNIPFLGRIPLDVAMPAAAERQVPLMALPGMYPAKEAFLQIAEKVVTGLPLRAMNLR